MVSLRKLDDLPPITYPPEVAAALGFTRQYIAQLAKRGKFPGARLFRRCVWLIPKASVIAHFAANRAAD